MSQLWVSRSVRSLILLCWLTECCVLALRRVARMPALYVITVFLQYKNAPSLSWCQTSQDKSFFFNSKNLLYGSTVCHVRIRIRKPYLFTSTDDWMRIKLNVILDVFGREMQAVHWCAMERCMGWCLGVKAVAYQATPVSMSKCVSSSTGSKTSWQQTLSVCFHIPTAFGPHTLYFIVHLSLFFTHVSSCMILGILCCAVFFFSVPTQSSEKVMW